MKSSKLRITLRRSPIGYEKSQGLTLRALGLRHLHQTVEKADTPAIRGMINKVVHLVTVETTNEEGAKGK
ncbi:MAG TPA: 50S ribosomal protein L30 [Chthonomonas sp.]|uniref:50S ribosomal protein L30 n=1 Tax=Chthonomonas sp. TaxID=2282153 RepID=UPI002B4AD33B|nr:50S ribosomal protein L30 [Chthonomonas sp.]HLI49613.1 50S ribosomal protein L30 [Chthonomonas sp.]